MAQEKVDVRTEDGVCPTLVFTPSQGAGPWPAVIYYMDGLAIRPTLFNMAQRIADEGFVVLLPDLFYRKGPYPPFDPKAVFEGDFRQILGPFFATTSAKKAGADDTAAFIAYLDTRQDVRGKKIGVTGYCVGGAMALTALATYPERVAAAASFHGGSLATDADVSPHLLASKMKGEIYIAAAVEDPSYPPAMEVRLKEAFDAAGVNYRHETYEGAKHGWTKADFPTYKRDAAERAHHELIALFRRTLG
ncbi:MAG: dienelactone hydrolase family protein [Terricaulis sp.]